MIGHQDIACFPPGFHHYGDLSKVGLAHGYRATWAEERGLESLVSMFSTVSAINNTTSVSDVVVSSSRVLLISFCSGLNSGILVLCLFFSSV